MRVTIRQVAEEAGVSKTTVSKVLVGRDKEIPDSTRKKVLRIVREMGYVPVRTAFQNRHVPTRVLAFPIDSLLRLRYSTNTETYFGLCEGAVQHGYDVLTLLRTDSNWVDQRREFRFLDRRSDGVIFDLSVLDDTSSDLEALSRHHVPTVVCYSREVPDGMGWVDPDNRGAIYGNVEYLLSKGHRRIAFLTVQQEPGPESYFDKGERLRFFLESVQEFGIGECAEWIFSAWYGQVPPDLPQRILALGATAVVCVNDGFALELMRLARASQIAVPEDLSIVGVDNFGAEPWGLTTMGFSFPEIGQRAVDALVNLIGDGPVEKSRIVVPVSLYERQSVKALKSR